MARLDNHFTRKMNIYIERREFRAITQDPSETIERFVLGLRQKSGRRGFETQVESNIIEQIIEITMGIDSGAEINVISHVHGQMERFKKTRCKNQTNDKGIKQKFKSIWKLRATYCRR